MAILAALQSAAIFRLGKSWMELGSKDRSNFKRIAALFSEENNNQRLREHMTSLRLQPCIPHMGMYLTGSHLGFCVLLEQASVPEPMRLTVLLCHASVCLCLRVCSCLCLPAQAILYACVLFVSACVLLRLWPPAPSPSPSV